MQKNAKNADLLRLFTCSRCFLALRSKSAEDFEQLFHFPPCLQPSIRNHPRFLCCLSNCGPIFTRTFKLTHLLGQIFPLSLFVWRNPLSLRISSCAFPDNNRNVNINLQLRNYLVFSFITRFLL